MKMEAEKRIMLGASFLTLVDDAGGGVARGIAAGGKEGGGKPNVGDGEGGGTGV